MGRKKRKAKRRKKSFERRARRRKAGKPSFFTLSNYSKQLMGATQRYYFKANLHNVNFKGSEFTRCRFKAGHITDTSMRDTIFNGCDFIKVNFRGTSFRNAHFKNCHFFQCNVDGCSMDGASFENTYFSSMSVSDLRKGDIPSSIVNNAYPQLNITDEFNRALLEFGNMPKIQRYNVLLSNKSKINNWGLSILLGEFSEQKIELFIKLIIKKYSTNKRLFITLDSFRQDLLRYRPDML